MNTSPSLPAAAAATIDPPATPDLHEEQFLRAGRRWLAVLRIVFCVLGLLVWLAFTENTIHERRITLSAVSERDANLAVAMQHYATRVIRVAAAVHGLVANAVVERRSDADVAALLADRLRANDVFEELGLCFAGGRVLPQPGPASRLVPAECEAILKESPRGPRVNVLAPRGAPGHLVVPLTTAIEDADGRFLALAVAYTKSETLLGSLNSAAFQDDTAVVLSGADGEVRAAWRSQGSHVTRPEGFLQFREMVRGGGESARIGARAYRVSARDLPGQRLRVQVATATRDALAAANARRNGFFVMCLLVTIALAMAYRLLTRVHERGLRHAKALGEARAELQALNERLDSQVQRRTRQLELAYRELESFSYTVAHDVRAPLASIAGFAEALEPALASCGTDKQRHYLRRIQANAAQMDGLTRQLLELGRLTQGALVEAVVDLSELAREIVQQLQEGEPQRRVAVEIAPGLAARGDRTLLRQALANLLGNAWKFTSRTDGATISFARQEDRETPQLVAFVVADNGDGFDSNAADGLFRPFRRLHAASEFPGTGVGLATVQRVVTLHGGEVDCRSRPGQGACFFFSLPRP